MALKAIIPGQESGGSLSITDGTTTVSGVTELTVSGATVGGSTPDATLTVSGAGAPSILVEGGASEKISAMAPLANPPGAPGAMVAVAVPGNTTQTYQSPIVTLLTGAPGNTTEPGEGINIAAGAGAEPGSGNVSITAGDNTSATKYAGDVFLTGGNGAGGGGGLCVFTGGNDSGSGTGGSCSMIGGDSAGGAGGSVSLAAGSSGGAPGSTSMSAGNCATAASAAGDSGMYGGKGSNGGGGQAVMYAGSDTADGDGGNVQYWAGSSAGSGAAGSVYLWGRNTGTGTEGGDVSVSLGVTGTDPLGKLVVNGDAFLMASSLSWKSGDALDGRTIFTATRALLITAVIVRVDTPNVAAATLLAAQAASGEAYSAGNPLTTNSADLAGTAATNQTLTLETPSVRLAPGDSLGLVATGVLAESSGCITIHMTPQ